MPRLFAGIEVPPHVRAMLSGLQGGLPGARWVEPSDFHITLRFIGDIGNRMAQAIASLLADVGSFGGDKPHSVFATVEPNRSLTDLQSEVERLVRACGLPVDKRKFQPHVTLARLRGSSPLDVAEYLSMRGYFPPQSYSADRFVLYSSRASVGGGPYIVETAYPLRRAAQEAPSNNRG